LNYPLTLAECLYCTCGDHWKHFLSVETEALVCWQSREYREVDVVKAGDVG